MKEKDLIAGATIAVGPPALKEGKDRLRARIPSRCRLGL